MAVRPWEPFCGEEFYGPVAGRPVVCDLEAHEASVMHRTSETGFRWWGFASYPRTPLRGDEDAAA